MSSVSLSNNRVYTMGNVDNTDHIICLNAFTGAQLWRYSYPCSPVDPQGYNGPRCTPTVDARLVYTVSRLGHVICLNADSGVLIWSRNLLGDFNGNLPPWGYSGSPLVVGNLLIVEAGAPNRSVIAFNKLTGAVVWANGNDFAGYSSPMPFKLGTYDGVAVFSANAVTGRLASNGSVLWSFAWKTKDQVNAATPLIFEDKIFVSSGYNSGCGLYVIGNRFARRIWANRNMRNHVSSCVRVGGHLFGFDEGQLRCLDMFTGLVKWSTSAYGKGSLMTANNKLIVLSERGMLASVEADPWQYREHSRLQVVGGRSTWAPPVLSNRHIYVRSQDDLVCLSVELK